MTITIPTISALPTAPSRTDPATFATRGDAFVASLATLRTEMNTTTAAIKTEVEAEVAATSAALARVGYPETLRAVSITGTPSTIDFVHGVSGVVISSAYDVYELELINVVLSASGATLHLRTSTDLGVNWTQGASDYAFAINLNSPAANNNVTSTAATAAQISGPTGVANSPVSGKVILYAPASAAACYLSADMLVASSSLPMRVTGAGVKIPTTDVDGIRIYPSAGTFVSGTVNFKAYRK